MKLGVLHTRLSGHFSANLRELRRSGHASMVFHYPFSPDAPFSEQQFDDIGTTKKFQRVFAECYHRTLIRLRSGRNTRRRLERPLLSKSVSPF